MKYVSILLVLISFSCKKGNSDPISFGYHYFPINQGHFVAYDVIDIRHDDLVGVHDTNYYQIKEVVGESFQDEEGEEAHKLHRYYTLKPALYGFNTQCQVN